MKKEEGVIDMPLRLMIIAVILVITVPMVLGVVNYYSRAATQQQLVSGVRYLENQEKIVFAEGANASMVVRVTFPYGTQYIKIGGKLGTDDSHLIRYKLINGMEHQDIVRYGNIDICMMSAKGGTLTVVGGTYDFIITKMKSPIDLNGDHILNDYYIQIEVRQ
ncbi:MAG: hypothetical protein GXO25_07020 [Euryarchaeota archaeon]|nr:hypothetical protein [Euryarchaeota archaeon]